MNPLPFILLAISLPLLLGGCGVEEPSSEGSESASENPTAPSEEVKPTEEASVDPNLKYEIKDDTVTITGCDKKASGTLTISAVIEGKPVTSIGRAAFSLCTSLTGITIPDGVTSIGDFAFRGCRSLTNITIPDSVISIGGSAFYECRSLTSITIPDGVTSIGERAFSYCSNLTSITIPDSVTSIGNGAFDHCTSLTTIEVGAGNMNYTEVNGVLFNKEKTLLHTYPVGKTDANYNIPDSVTSIGDWAFFLCTSLTSITIPDGVTSIGDEAFSWCKSLTSITIPDSVTMIGFAVFSGCKSLTSATIPDGVTSIGEEAFDYCTSLTAVTFLGNAPKAGERVFFDSFLTIYRKPEAKGWGDTFGGRPVKLISEKP